MITMNRATVSSNSINYRKALDLFAIDYNIGAGVTDNGYRIGLGVQGYVADPDFRGTLESQYGVWARNGAYEGTAGRINNSCGVYIETLTNSSTTFGNLFGLYQGGPSAKNFFQAASASARPHRHTLCTLSVMPPRQPVPHGLNLGRALKDKHPAH